jgi:hypothetical protein
MVKEKTLKNCIVYICPMIEVLQWKCLVLFYMISRFFASGETLCIADQRMSNGSVSRKKSSKEKNYKRAISAGWTHFFTNDASVICSIENTSYSRKLHIPAPPISPERLTTNSGIPRTTVYLKYKVPRVLRDSPESRKIPFVPSRGTNGAVPKNFRDGTNGIGTIWKKTLSRNF